MTPLEHENFWHRQVTEHLDFMNLLLTDPIEKAEAAKLRAVYGPALGSARKTLTATVIEWQEHVLARQKQGEILGPFPLFVEHITVEARLLQWLAWDAAPEPELGLAATLTAIGAEHALFAAHLLDPTERPLVAEANDAADDLYAYTLSLAEEGVSVSDGAATAMRSLGAWVVNHGLGHGGALSIVPPALADHVVREQDYGDVVLREGR